MTDKNSEPDTDSKLSPGDVVEVTERHQVIGIEGQDVLTLQLDADGSVIRWDNGLFDRPGVSVKHVDCDKEREE